MVDSDGRTEREDASTDRTTVDGAVDALADDSAGDSADDSAGEAGSRTGPGDREVIVPLRLYKTVVVFSTFVAIVSFVLGFLLLDAATLQVSLFRSVVLAAVTALGIGVSPDVVTPVLAIAGLAVIGFGSAVYVFGTRFRFRGMGKPQEDSREGSNDG